MLLPDFQLPDSFEAYRLNGNLSQIAPGNGLAKDLLDQTNDLLGQAYEAATPAQRGRIKTTLALVQSVYAEHPTLQECRVVRAASGFGSHVRQRPAPWIVAVLCPGFEHATSLAAALMPARLAGVSNVVVLCAASPATMPADVLACLELTGVEHVLALPEADSRTLPPAQTRTSGLEQDLVQGAQGTQGVHGAQGAQDLVQGIVQDLMQSLVASHGRGRLLVFAEAKAGRNAGLSLPAQLMHGAARLGVPCWKTLSTPPVEAPCDAPDDTPVQEGPPEPDCCEGALHSHKVDPAVPSPETFPPLILGPGLEGCFFHPDLPLDFFLERSTTLFAVLPPTDTMS